MADDNMNMVVSPRFGIAFFTGPAGFELFYACCNSDTVTSNKGNLTNGNSNGKESHDFVTIYHLTATICQVLLLA